MDVSEQEMACVLCGETVCDDVVWRCVGAVLHVAHELCAKKNVLHPACPACNGEDVMVKDAMLAPMVKEGNTRTCDNEGCGFEMVSWDTEHEKTCAYVTMRCILCKKGPFTWETWHEHAFTGGCGSANVGLALSAREEFTIHPKPLVALVESVGFLVVTSEDGTGMDKDGNYLVRMLMQKESNRKWTVHVRGKYGIESVQTVSESVFGGALTEAVRVPRNLGTRWSVSLSMTALTDGQTGALPKMHDSAALVKLCRDKGMFLSNCKLPFKGTHNCHVFMHSMVRGTKRVTVNGVGEKIAHADTGKNIISRICYEFVENGKRVFKHLHTTEGKSCERLNEMFTSALRWLPTAEDAIRIMQGMDRHSDQCKLRMLLLIFGSEIHMHYERK